MKSFLGTGVIFVFIIVSSIFILLSCGGNDNNETEYSGLDRTQLLSSLDTEEKMSLCKWEEDILTKAGKDTECNSVDTLQTISVPLSAEECASDQMHFSDCEVALRENCVNAIAKNICSEDLPVECDEYQKCKAESDPPDNSGLCGLFGGNILECIAVFEVPTVNGNIGYRYEKCFKTLTTEWCPCGLECMSWFCNGCEIADMQSKLKELEKRCIEEADCPAGANNYVSSNAKRLIF